MFAASCVSFVLFIQQSFSPQCCLAFLSCHSSNQIIRYLLATRATLAVVGLYLYTLSL